MKRFKTKAILAVGLVAMFALLAGCGSSDDSTTDSGGDFVAEANAICANLESDGKAIPEPKSKGEVADYLDQAVPLTADAISSLEDVSGVPSDQQEDYDAWVDTLKDQQDILEKAQDEAASDPDQAIATLNETDAVDTDSDAKATALGLTTCAENGDGGGSSGGSS